MSPPCVIRIFELERVFTRLVREGAATEYHRRWFWEIMDGMSRWDARTYRTEGRTFRFSVVYLDGRVVAHGDYLPASYGLGHCQSGGCGADPVGAERGLPAMDHLPDMTSSCLLVRDCLPDQVAYLTRVYDNLVGLASADGYCCTRCQRKRFQEATLAFEPISDRAVGRRLVRHPWAGTPRRARSRQQCRPRFQPPVVVAGVRLATVTAADRGSTSSSIKRIFAVDRLPVSAVVIAYNDEPNMRACLDSLHLGG